MSQLILASSSPYRKELLSRFAIPFECISPDVDESQIENEPPELYVSRLAKVKAQKIGQDHPEKLIIGSDQCCVNAGIILGKPKDRDNAIDQLLNASGNTINFLTAVCIYHPQSKWIQEWTDAFSVEFRDLTQEEIERYLDAEEPYNCAGSFKSERLGVTLCKSMQGDDPTTLIGLPLIKVAQSLRDFGLNLP